jgi:hypothetical protein
MTNLNLMVGDWVNYKDTPYKIDAVSKLYPFIDDARFGLGIVTWDNIQPIPLTPDVLEKINSIYKNENGGTRYGFLDGYYNIDSDTCLVAIFEDDGLLHIYTYEYSHEQFQLVCNFQYFHQLQQLIRLFTGKEIVVKW